MCELPISMSKRYTKPQKTAIKRALSAVFSFVLVSNFLSPAFAYADGSNLIVSQTISFSTPGNSLWTVPAGISAITAEVWSAGGAGGSGKKTNNSNLSGTGGGGGGYTQETVNVNPGDVYSVTVGTGGQGDGENGGVSSLVGPSANLLTTGGFAGTSDTGTGSGYPTAGGLGGIGNGGNSATNLGGGNGGTEGCDPGNCGGNARASAGGGAAASGAGGVGDVSGDSNNTNGIAGSSGVANISGGGAGGAAGWEGRDGTCNGGCASGGALAQDGIFPGGGGGGSDTGPGGYGANGEVVIETLVPAAPTAQAPVSSSDATIQLGQPFNPTYVGGSGTGSWQFVVSDYTNWNPGNGYTGTDIGPDPSTDPFADYFLTWTPSATGTYQFYIAKNGDSNYTVSNFAGPYNLTVVSSGTGGTNLPTSSTSPSVDISVASPNLNVGSDATITSVAFGSGLTQHGIELSFDNINWQNVGASNPPTDGTDTLVVILPFPTSGTFYVRAYASNDSGESYIYTYPQTITVSAPSGGGNPGNPISTSTPTVTISLATTSIMVGEAVGVTTTATGGTLTQHGVEICLVGGNCPTNASSGNWQNVGASNPPKNPSDTLSINPALPAVGTYGVRAYASNDGGATYGYSDVDTVTVTSSSGGGNPSNPTYVLEVLPQGGGTVTSNPSGISCSSASGCSATFNAGTPVTLTEAPAAGNVFSTWGNDCASAGASSTCSVVINSDLIARATFSLASTTIVSLSLDSASIIAGGVVNSTTLATSTSGVLTQHGLETSVSGANSWTNAGASNPPSGTTDVLSVAIPFPTAGSYDIRAYASNDGGATYAYSSIDTVTVNAPSSGGGRFVGRGK